MKRLLLRGGLLLGVSAVVSKLLGLWRDRLFLDIYSSSETVDLIFAAFRIPDFFFFLLIGGTVSTLLIPRLHHLEKKEQEQFFSSFIWGVSLFFGILCIFGILTTPWLVRIFSAGFSSELQEQMIPLARYLFGSVFLLSISSVFAAYHQSKEKFLSLAIAPVLYTGMICGVLFFLRDDFGLSSVGIAALSGAFLHLFVNSFVYFLKGNRLVSSWYKPKSAWKNFSSDFLFRILNTSSFQINQTIDILIASFLIAGSVTAFALGSALGGVLLSIVGLPLANASFPKLTQYKHKWDTQKKILWKNIKWILLWTIPAVIFCFIFSEWVLRFIYDLSGTRLWMTNQVFLWTIASLPFACSIPILSRVFLANDDTKTPLKITALSLSIATGLALYFSFLVFSGKSQIIGLAIGNFSANVLSASFFLIVLLKKTTNDKH